MGTVNIPVNVVQGVLQTPAKGVANKLNQQIIWTISNPPNSGVTFSSTTSPFVFPTPPPSGYDQWPGGIPTPGPGANQWQVDVNDQLPNGQTQTYKYDINYTNTHGPQTMDPEIENQGYPPSPEGEEERPGKGKGRDKDDN